MEKDIYNGLFHIKHNPLAKGRAPRYIVEETTSKKVTKPIGVTSILSKTLSKDLMQWAVDCSIDYLRDKLPIITEKELGEASKAYITKRDFGATTGSSAHELVELFLKEDTVKLEKALKTASKEAVNAFNAFKEWFEKVHPVVLGVEEVIYSQSLEYAGTYDALLCIKGKNYICDFKTTNISKKAPQGIYPENFLQLGAYAAAHIEQRVYEQEHGGTDLLPIEGLMVISGKKNGKLDILTNEDLGLAVADCMTGFVFVQGIYAYMKDITDRLGGK